jgi:hypothetical protein
MKTCEFDRQVLWPLIIFVVGSTIAFIVILITIRKKSRRINFREIKRENKEKIALKELVQMGSPCFVIPVAGIGAAYFFEWSFRWKIISSFLGFSVAVAVSVFITWRLKKNGKII